ncbi:MAG: GAF domain-containing protein [Acidobacteriota bacterium]|nr:GAF domain-containing protein [Acidobacteriota bacterium]
MIEAPQSGMELRPLLEQSDFLCRRMSGRNPDREVIALRRLGKRFIESPESILQELVDIALEYCGADSSGISLEERNEAGELQFRWIVVAGSFARYLNGTTPRNYSPCGSCLDQGTPQLYRVTKLYYDYLGVQAEPITDGMLIPWKSTNMRGTIWAVSHQAEAAFDLLDYELLKSLAEFIEIAVQHQFHQLKLLAEERRKTEQLKANELAHAINNPLQSLSNSIYLASQGGEGAMSHLGTASEEVKRLSEMVATLLHKK